MMENWISPNYFAARQLFTNISREHIIKACSSLVYSRNPLQIYPDPKDYGYKIDESGMLVLQILGGPARPADMPSPCSCKKYNRLTCKCKAIRWKCSKICNCSKYVRIHTTMQN